MSYELLIGDCRYYTKAVNAARAVKDGIVIQIDVKVFPDAEVFPALPNLNATVKICST